MYLFGSWVADPKRAKTKQNKTKRQLQNMNTVQYFWPHFQWDMNQSDIGRSKHLRSKGLGKHWGWGLGKGKKDGEVAREWACQSYVAAEISCQATHCLLLCEIWNGCDLLEIRGKELWSAPQGATAPEPARTTSHHKGSSTSSIILTSTPDMGIELSFECGCQAFGLCMT